MTHTTNPPPAPEVFEAADGSRWQQAGVDDNGVQLYVLEGVAPETCPRWVRARENELVGLVGALTPVTNSGTETGR